VQRIRLQMAGRRLYGIAGLCVFLAGLAVTASQPVGAASPFVVQDTFQRANQSGWGTASNGMTWAPSAGITAGDGSLAISSNEGVISGSSQHSTFETLGSATAADVSGLMRFSDSDGQELLGMTLRGQSSGNMDLLRYDGSNAFQFMVRSGGAWTVVSTTSFPITAGGFYWLRFQVQATSVSFRAWPDGSPEPATWAWTGTSATVTGPGTMGLYGYASPGSSVEFDSFSVAPVGGPSAALSLSPTVAPVATAVTADASQSTPGSNPIQSYTFAFGDGTTVGPQAGATATHSYSAGGVYTVSVTVTDSAGNSAQATAQETVAQPKAALNVSPGSGPPPLVVTADASGSTDTTGVSIASYSFAFGDGTTAGPQAAATASHTYTATGSYTVTVTVTDSAGATSSATAAVSVANGPSAALRLTPSVAPVGTAVTADASTSVAGSSPIQSYTFAFGDGTTVGPQAGATATHAYTAGGVYTVTVTVTDSAGNSSKATAQEAVAQPKAALKVTPASGPAPLAVTADASGSTDTGGVSITSYTFAFGDGSTTGPQAGATAAHTYLANGSYTATVSVTDSTGATATATVTVIVATPPAAALTVTPTSGTVPLTVSADASASTPGSNPIQSYTFNFGDGTVSGPQSSATAAHTYTSGGSYTVTVTVTDSAGLTSSASQTLTATATYIVQDTFQRTNQNGWGTASNGMAWSPAVGESIGDGSLSISSDEGKLTGSSQRSTFEILGSATTADGNALVRFSTFDGGEPAGIILRHQSNGDMDLVRYDGGGHLVFMVRSGGSWTTSQTIASFSASPNTFYWLRFEAQGSNLFVKVWPASVTEPTAWTWTGTSTTITAAGTMGLYGYASTGSDVLFDSFTVAPVSFSPPNSTIRGSVTDSVSGKGISGVTVSTIPSSTTATTSSTGSYSLPVPAGTYTVVFTASGVGYNDNDVTAVQAPAGGSVTASQKLVAIPPTVAMDTFTQPDQTGGWNPSTDGNTWVSDIGNPPNGVPINGAGITGSQAWVDTSGSSFQDLDTWMGYQYADMQVTADVDVTTVVQDGTYLHGPRLLARVQGTPTNWDAIVMTVDPPDGLNPVPPGSSTACTNGDISLWVTIPSSWTDMAMVCQTVSLNTLYHVKLDVIGNLVEGKVWSGSSEPAAWQISASMTAQDLLSGTGQAGTRTTGSYVDYANFMETPITQISGTITSTATGNPIAGATVTLSNGLTTTTDAHGNYSLSGVPGVLTGGSSYTLTASAAGFTTGSAKVTPTTGVTNTVNLSLT